MGKQDITPDELYLLIESYMKKINPEFKMLFADIGLGMTGRLLSSIHSQYEEQMRRFIGTEDLLMHGRYIPLSMDLTGETGIMANISLDEYSALVNPDLSAYEKMGERFHEVAGIERILQKKKMLVRETDEHYCSSTDEKRTILNYNVRHFGFDKGKLAESISGLFEQGYQQRILKAEEGNLVESFSEVMAWIRHS